MVEFEDRGITQILSLIVGFPHWLPVEWLFRRATRACSAGSSPCCCKRLRKRLRRPWYSDELRAWPGRGVRDRECRRVFAFTWPPPLREIVLGYLAPAWCSGSSW